MRLTSRIIILILAIVASIIDVQAQSPQAQLQQLVTQLQTTPSDSAQQTFYGLLDTAKKLADARQDIAQMLKEQAKQTAKP